MKKHLCSKVIDTNDGTALVRDMRSARRPNSIRVRVLPSFARLWLIPRLPDLQGRPIDLDTQVVSEHRIASFEARETDVAIRFGHGDWPGTKGPKLKNCLKIRFAPTRIPRSLRRSTMIFEDFWTRRFFMTGAAMIGAGGSPPQA